MGGFIFGLLIGTVLVSGLYGFLAWLALRKVANYLADKPEVRVDLQQLLVGAFQSPKVVEEPQDNGPVQI